MLLGISEPALQPLTEGLWAAVRAQGSANGAAAGAAAADTAAASSAAAGITLEDLTIAKVGLQGILRLALVSPGASAPGRHLRLDAAFTPAGAAV